MERARVLENHELNGLFSNIGGGGGFLSNIGGGGGFLSNIGGGKSGGGFLSNIGGGKSGGGLFSNILNNDSGGNNRNNIQPTNLPEITINPVIQQPSNVQQNQNNSAISKQDMFVIFGTGGAALLVTLLLSN